MDPPLSTLVPHHPPQHTTTHGVSESVESSPKSTTHQDHWDEPLAPIPGAKLRLMCSYGGHIVPRPHDKTLCYVGGETRIFVAERNSPLSEFCNRLSQTLLDGRKFTLKYQLPNEDLDSLISVSNDEDLENMIEEYDRISAAISFLKPAQNRLRLFLFLAKPETAQTMGALLDDAQSENWFVDALNTANGLPRGLSDSAAVGDLLRLDSGGTNDPGLQLPPDCSGTAAQPKVVQQDIHSIQSIMSDSPMVETSASSFDSSTSSPSMAHLPPIRVRLEENNDGTTRIHGEIKCGGGLEEHFSTQIRVTPPLTSTMEPTSEPVSNATMEGNDNNCDESDREGLPENGVARAARKPPLPLALQGMEQRIISGGGGFNLPSPNNEMKHGGGFNLPSPDSVNSESSTASGISFTKAPLHQDHAQVITSNENKTHVIPEQTNERISNNRTPSHQIQQPTHDTTKYIYPPHQYEQHQHQFIKENVHYIQTHPHISSYCPVYTPQPPPIHHPQVDRQQQYSMYLLPVTQTQPYNASQIPSLVPPSQVGHTYPTRASAVAAAATSDAQYQQQHLGFSAAAGTSDAQYQQQHLGYSAAAVHQMGGNSGNYGHFDYGHNQVYYTGQLAATGPVHVAAAPPQYQSITPAQAAMIAEASMKLPKTECTKQKPTS